MYHSMHLSFLELLLPKTKCVPVSVSYGVFPNQLLSKCLPAPTGSTWPASLAWNKTLIDPQSILHRGRQDLAAIWPLNFTLCQTGQLARLILNFSDSHWPPAPINAAIMDSGDRKVRVSCLNSKRLPHCWLRHRHVFLSISRCRCTPWYKAHNFSKVSADTLWISDTHKKISVSPPPTSSFALYHPVDGVIVFCHRPWVHISMIIQMLVTP